VETTREEMVMDYQQKIRDVILLAVDREIPIWKAATMVEAIIKSEIDGSK